jgi:hypothetical protein
MSQVFSIPRKGLKKPSQSLILLKKPRKARRKKMERKQISSETLQVLMELRLRIWKKTNR